MRDSLLRMLLVLLASPLWALDYAVMIDSGSSGSRVFIYEIEAGRIKFKNKLKIEPGLSQFEKNLSGVKPYLSKLVDFAKEQLGENVQIDQVPITLQATGGVRVLSKQGQKRVIQAAQKALSESGFKSPKAEVISGVTEGIYQWIAINYLTGSLENSTKKTLGLVEMGGASLQVTFSENQPLLPGKVDPQLYSRTYDGFGELLAWKRLGPKGCSKIPLNYADCRKSLARRIQTIKRPRLQGEFYLVDNFEQLASLLKLEKISSEILDQHGPAICRKSLKTLLKELPGHSAKHYLSRVCFQTAYMSVVLEKIGFQRKRELIAAKQIEDTTLSWTLGSLVDNMLSSQKTVAMP